VCRRCRVLLRRPVSKKHDPRVERLRLEQFERNPAAVKHALAPTEHRRMDPEAKLVDQAVSRELVSEQAASVSWMNHSSMRSITPSRVISQETTKLPTRQRPLASFSLTRCLTNFLINATGSGSAYENRRVAFPDMYFLTSGYLST